MVSHCKEGDAFEVEIWCKGLFRGKLSQIEKVGKVKIIIEIVDFNNQ